MKSPDNNIDRALKAALKRKFDDFEAEVERSSEDIILTSSNRSYWQSAGSKSVVFAGLVTVLFFSSLLYFSIFTEKETASVNINTESNSQSRRKSPKVTHDSGVSQNKVPDAPIGNKLIGLNNQINNPKTLKINTKGPKRAASAGMSSGGSKPIEIDETYENNINISAVLPQSGQKQIGDYVIEPEVSINSLNPGKQDDNPDLKDRVIPITFDLDIIGKRPFEQYSFDPRLSIELPATAGEEENKISDRTKKKFGFVFNTVALNTIQILTVKASPGVVYQNVSVPSEIYPDQLSYKFSGGITQGAFQLLFSYGQLNQSFRYEIKSDKFELQKTDEEYYLVTKGIQHQQNNKLKFVGLGLKRHGVITNSSIFQNYFGDVGLEFSRELSTKTNVLWGNVAIGKEILISKNSKLNIGPYVEYSFTKMINPDTKFQVQPYQIGLSLGFRFLN
ncbi:hypothetical protein L0657_05560 [Dyadobacter sp. CY345]|uniref:hypothetical protein n=1 Tax=Dyadobacter sp. CY345 TaxID=2909335 RepID=UPI001F232AFA|nr:hypothetical protein [Dyadobacter sp. CY345]MCF2443416.1 hypothetical protein [Dyadobacter sp. CY345]